MDKFSDVCQLEQSGSSVGGLIIKKKESDKDKDVFKKPKPSLLGLDRLAATQRARKQQEAARLSFKDSDGNDLDDEDDTRDYSERRDRNKHTSASSSSSSSKKYRESTVETPSYTGGVSEAARKRLDERSKEDYQGKGLYASSKSKKDRDRDDRDDERKRHKFSSNSSRSNRGESSHRTPG